MRSSTNTARWLILASTGMVTLLGLPRPGHLDAAEPLVLKPGEWVRVTAGSSVRSAPGRPLSEDSLTTTLEIGGRVVRVPRPGTTLEGAVRLLDPRTLELEGRREGPAIVVERHDIARLDVRRRESRKKRGAIKGLLIGVVVGAVAGAVAGSGGSGGMGIDATGAVAGGGAIIGAPLGALIGALVAPGARWEEVRGVRVSYAVRF